MVTHSFDHFLKDKAASHTSQLHVSQHYLSVSTYSFSKWSLMVHMWKQESTSGISGGFNPSCVSPHARQFELFFSAWSACHVRISCGTAVTWTDGPCAMRRGWQKLSRKSLSGNKRAEHSHCDCARDRISKRLRNPQIHLYICWQSKTLRADS